MVVPDAPGSLRPLGEGELPASHGVVQGERRGKVVPVVAQEPKLDLALGPRDAALGRRASGTCAPLSRHPRNSAKAATAVSIELRDLVLELPSADLWVHG